MHTYFDFLLVIHYISFNGHYVTLTKLFKNVGNDDICIIKIQLIKGFVGHLNLLDLLTVGSALCDDCGYQPDSCGGDLVCGAESGRCECPPALPIQYDGECCKYSKSST
jgi:hypothetical protein